MQLTGHAPATGCASCTPQQDDSPGSCPQSECTLQSRKSLHRSDFPAFLLQESASGGYVTVSSDSKRLVVRARNARTVQHASHRKSTTCHHHLMNKFRFCMSTSRTTPRLSSFWVGSLTRYSSTTSPALPSPDPAHTVPALNFEELLLLK